MSIFLSDMHIVHVARRNLFFAVATGLLIVAAAGFALSFCA